MQDKPKSFCIETLFDDDVLRVVRAYCRVKENSSDRSNPLVIIAFRRLDNNRIEYAKAAIAELDVLRIGSIWIGKVGIESNFKDKKNVKTGWFEFNLSNQETEF